jgi:hypothetical protein
MQETFRDEFACIFEDDLAPKTIVVIPSMTLDPMILSKVQAALHYEERLLCMLLLLRMPRTHIIYLSSVSVDEVIIDYYLQLLLGITGNHARQRIHFFSCYDSSSLSLTEKILARPRLIQRIHDAIPRGHSAHLSCFNVTEKERELAVRLKLPLYGCDPDLLYWGTKSGSRHLFREAGVPLLPGLEDLQNEDSIVKALVCLYRENKWLSKAVIKMNDGFSGDGNAIFDFGDLSRDGDLETAIRKRLPEHLMVVAKELGYRGFIDKFSSMGGIVEAFLEGDRKTSPSVQCRINPIGEVEVISTHDQWMGGPDEQIFQGGNFPANPDYNTELGVMGKKIAERLKEKGALGRFGVDFMSVCHEGKWLHYAIEINLRKGGTTHPFLMLQFLTGGDYNAPTGKYLLPTGEERHYLFTDNLQDERLKGLTPPDLMDIVMLNGLHFDSTRQEGVIFHMIGALSQYGKLGIICIGATKEKAHFYYEKALEVLFLEASQKVHY